MSPSPPISPIELKARREDVRRGLLRVNTAALAIIFVVVGLAIVAIVAASHANRNAAETRTANARAQAELWKSYLAQAAAGRFSLRMGRKSEGLKAIVSASRIRTSFELRNEAIAHHALFDLQEDLPYLDLGTNGLGTFDPDLLRYAASHLDGSVRLFNASNHQEIARWKEGPTWIRGLQFSRDGKLLAVLNYRSQLFIYDLGTNALSYSLEKSEWPVFSEDGRWMALKKVSDNTVYLLDPRTGLEKGRLTNAVAIHGMIFHPSSNHLAFNMGQEIRLVDVDSGKVVHQFRQERFISSMALTDDFLAVGSSSGEMRLVNFKSQKTQTIRAHQDSIDTLRFNPQGDLLVSTSYDGSSSFWNPLNGGKLLTTKDGFAAQFNRTGDRLGYIRKYGSGGIGTWKIFPPIGYRNLQFAEGRETGVKYLDFHPSGNFLLATGHDGLRILDFKSGELLVSQPIPAILCAAFLAGGNRLLVTTRTGLSIWPVNFDSGESNRVRLGNSQPFPVPRANRIETTTLSLDRRQAVLPIRQDASALVDLEETNQAVIFGGISNPGIGSISSDGKWVATGNFHGNGNFIWDAVTGKRVISLTRGNAHAFFSPDNKMVLIAGDREYRFFETGSWKLLHSISTESSIDLPNSAAFSKTGSLLALAIGHSQVNLFDAKTFQPLASLISPAAESISALMAFSEDGTSLAVGTGSGAIQAWDLSVLREELQKLGLDWGRAGEGKSPAVSTLAAGATAGGWGGLMLLAGGGMILVIFCSIFVLQRQRQLIASYMAIDSLMEERNKELEAAQVEIIQSQKMKALGTLAAGIAHDFNNLLSVIRMSSKLIEREAKPGSAIHENVVEIEEAVIQGKNVVRSMLGYSREEQDGAKTFSLPDLVEDTVGLLSKQFLSGITLNLELDAEVPKITGSRGALEQILLNLIVNASEAMKGKGTLQISVARSDEGVLPEFVLRPRPADLWVHLTVADSGPGISAEILPRIFEPFFTTKRVGAERGTGLGLSMVYNLAEKAGYGISVKSEAGKGAAFILTVPCGQGAQGSVEGESAE